MAALPASVTPWDNRDRPQPVAASGNSLQRTAGVALLFVALSGTPRRLTSQAAGGATASRENGAFFAFSPAGPTEEEAVWTPFLLVRNGIG